MPKISEFFGIAIYMYYRDHPPPHFHARYGRTDAVFDIRTLQLLEGAPSPRLRSLVIEWASQHRADLTRAWDQARQGLPIDPIAPLD